MTLVRPNPAAVSFTAFDLGLYGVTVFAWSTSWIALKMQVGVVAPEVSVFWRFLFAAALMLGWCAAAGYPLRFPLRTHLRFAATGALIFSLNFLCFYYGGLTLASGLLSVIFSLAAVVNLVLGVLLFHQRVDLRVALGALVGFLGVALMFWPEIIGHALGTAALGGLLLCCLGTLLFCLGNMLSASNQAHDLPVVPSTAWGMVYGTALMGVVALVLGRRFEMELTPAYLGGLAWLSVVSSVIAFSCYLTLLGRIGAARAGYATVIFPVFALAVSTLFEGYVWTVPALLGLAAVLAGNVIVLRSRRA